MAFSDGIEYGTPLSRMQQLVCTLLELFYYFRYIFRTKLLIIVKLVQVFSGREIKRAFELPVCIPFYFIYRILRYLVSI